MKELLHCPLIKCTQCYRLELSHFLSTLAGVPLGDVLVKDVKAMNISGSDCLTASLWITGVDGAQGEEGARECRRD